MLNREKKERRSYIVVVFDIMMIINIVKLCWQILQQLKGCWKHILVVVTIITKCGSNLSVLFALMQMICFYFCLIHKLKNIYNNKKKFQSFSNNC